MRTAILLSGGLDSAVLLAEEAARGDVQPVYVSVGLAWEDAERQWQRERFEEIVRAALADAAYAGLAAWATGAGGGCG